MKFKNTAILVILLFLLFPILVSADIISPGQKGAKHCIEISNINEFQDYEFYLVSFMGERVYGAQQLRQGRCESFYKHTMGKIYAREKQELDRFGLEAPIHIRLQGNNQTDVLKSLISSDVEIYLKATLPMFSLIKGQKDTYTIKSISNSLELDKKSSYTFEYIMIPIYIGAFAVTIFIEALLILLLTRKKIETGFKKSLGYSGIINTITYPLALLLYIFVVPSLILVEILVFLAEIFLIKHFLKTGYKDSFVISFTANFATLFLGIVLFFLLIFL